MSGREQLVEELSQLEDFDFVTVIEQVRKNRTAQRPALPERPTAFNRDALARWYAARHLAFDPGLRDVMFLPSGAPATEIRLLEVNVLSTTPDDVPPEALDFGTDRDLPGEHTLLVADLSPGQWDRIRTGELDLPAGWELAGRQTIGRRG